MAQIFRPSANTISKLSILAAVFVLASVFGIGMALNNSPYYTRVDVAIEQPVPFSHKHHVKGIGIDCRYCHNTVEKTAFAGLPTTKTCMNCHVSIWSDSPTLAPVRDSFKNGESIEWNRVHDLPDFVYFDHSIHIHKGIGCESCHGRVDEMPLARRKNTLHMSWCLECHRNPEKFVRPREHVFEMGWKAENQEELGKELVAKYNIQKRTDCSVCHR